jgi:membrane associated rhomboid family serine protease
MSSTPAPSVPRCYRHPDRETYIRCSRCERPICPDCMTSAPVGYQCPECVREGSKSVRQARTPLGAKIHERGDLVTKVLIGANVVVWLVGLLVGYRQLLEPFALANLVRFEPGAPLVGVQVGEWYRTLTAAFLHQQIWHIGLNMFALWILGSMLEPVLGRWRFIALYVLSALGGSVVSLLGLPPGGIAIGASGAVFGLFGALFVVARRFGRDVTSVVFILAINAVISFTVPTIDWRAHLGGLITGALVAFAFAHAPKSHRLGSSIAAVAVMAALIVGVAVVFVV